MSDLDPEVAEASWSNFATFMEHGPGLRMDYRTWIEAKDSPRGRYLLGGLGGMGMGRMWCDVELATAQGKPGFATAPEDPAAKDDFGQTSTGKWYEDEP